MAGLPDYTNNPIQSGNYGQNGDKSMEVALASKMQLVLDQPMTDVDSGLTNRDFEGDFFKIGDSVAIVKPDVNSLTIAFGEIGSDYTTGAITTTPLGKPLVDDTTAGVYYQDKDARLIPQNVSFEKNVLTINKYTKYAFYLSDVTKAEGKWNYESGNLDLVAQELRKRHNLETCQLIVDHNGNTTAVNEVGAIPSIASGTITTTSTSTTTATTSTALDPIVVADGDELYEKVIVPMYAQLYDAGAITADGQITYGSNAQQGKATYGKVYMPTKAYTTLLVSKYLQDRSTVAADEKVETGKLKTIMGLDVAVEPSLNPNAKRHITLEDGAGSDVFVIIAGTRNLVTKAGKVLPPERFRSHKFFADEFHGMEIYGKKVVEPKAACIAFVKIQPKNA